jgi:hypothetical protein
MATTAWHTREFKAPFSAGKNEDAVALCGAGKAIPNGMRNSVNASKKTVEPPPS